MEGCYSCIVGTQFCRFNITGSAFLGHPELQEWVKISILHCIAISGPKFNINSAIFDQLKPLASGGL